jgi:asparagine synthase (glutamine-hydrolysing)
MCGIAGVVGLKDSRAAFAAVKRMTTALAKRGPDGEGSSSWPGTVFGHRRLAIFDLSEAGRQPMLTPDGEAGVVFNGAIYNFRELRAELLASGLQFVSQTDTEVLLQGYRRWGLDGLVHRLRGMFAFALWDNRAHRLYLVRDRLGVKPLIYAVRDGAIAFASTVRGLAMAGFAGELDPDSIREFMIAGFLADDRVIYRGVRKLPAASILEWSEGAFTIRNYWSPPHAMRQEGVSFRGALEETKSLILDAVRARLFADVPVAALLSGGIDSSLVCWAVRQVGGDLTAFTVATPGDEWDESGEASVTAQKLGLKHCVIDVSPSDFNDVAQLASAYAEPFGSASALGMLNVSRAVSSSGGVKVLLTGDGGDDVFLGYSRHRNIWIANRIAETFSSAVAGRCRTVTSWIPRIGVLGRASALLEYSTRGLDAVVRNARREDVYEASQLLGERFAAMPHDRRDHQWPTSGRTILDDSLVYERNTRFVGEYMTKVDGGAMFHGVEARSPFLDHNIWEFAAALPYGIRLHGGRLKSVLRQIVREEIGESIANRPKRGFGIPVQRWIAGRWRSAVEAMLHDSILEKEGWIRRGSGVGRLAAVRANGIAPNQLWYMLVLESWLRHERQLGSRSACE